MIPYGRQHVDEDDIAAVTAALRSSFLTGGPAVEAFERAVAERVEARHAVAFSSGTAGLHAAAAVSGLGPGDVVATPSLSFAASANCARYVGAEVTFVDIDEGTLNLDPEAVPPVDALVAVHFAGLPVDLTRLAHRPRVVIEDAAHAFGAVGPDGPVGNCARSDLCVFSFHPVKTITSAEGGMVTTNSDELADRLRRFRNHGIDRSAPTDPWAYDIAEPGFNYRLSDVHAALGLSQLDKADRFVERRNELADRYDEALAELPVQLPPGAPRAWVHARHLYPLRVPHRREVYEALHASGVAVQVHYVPIHHLGRFAATGIDLPATERAGSSLLSLPLFPALGDDDQDRVIDAVRAAVGAVSAR